MRGKRVLRAVIIVLVFSLAVILAAQGQKREQANGSFWDDAWKYLIAMFVGGALLKYIEFLWRNRIARQKKQSELEGQQAFEEKQLARDARQAEEIYTNALKEEMVCLHLLGSPDIKNQPVNLEDVFVSMRISEAWRSDRRFEMGKKRLEEEFKRLNHLSPQEVMKLAFKKYRLLLVIGDPGSGKTTLLKYYAVHCLGKDKKKRRLLGFRKEILPIYFPLRELTFSDDEEPATLPESLSQWAQRRQLDISPQLFNTLLRKRNTLVLLDGLDEVGSKEYRKKICRWVKGMYSGFVKARFVLTSRATGYRKLDGIELALPHLRADIMDFSPEQQEEFLQKWFRTVFLAGLPPKDMSERQWKRKQWQAANSRSQKIVDFLNKKENKAVQELAAVPMLLQIVAILWKDRKSLPRSRSALYDKALDYLLDYRDREKEIEPLLPFEEARLVLMPAALWMQKEKMDEASKNEMHKQMQEVLNTMEGQHPAEEFCTYLRDRAGLIADYDRDHYIFRHKSFREFLAALQLREKWDKEDCIQLLIEHFNNDWWEETLRFFMSKTDDVIFDSFMQGLFQSPVSQRLDAHHQTLLQNLVKESPQKRTDALGLCLNNVELNDNQRRYIMDCLKTIGTPEAIRAIEQANKALLDESNISYAEDIVAESEAITVTPRPREKAVEEIAVQTGEAFRNPFEGNVEYIKIPGGTYTYSLTKESVTVPAFYLCKYPVTNQRYRRFIAYLEGEEKEYAGNLPMDLFAEKLLQFSKTVKGYNEYIGKNPGDWKDKFRSGYDDEKRFNSDDQPVVAVTWYAARAYCFWLSCLEAAAKESDLLKDIEYLASLYRLPTETEWEWAAGGEPDGTVRKYPWPADKGEPTPELANYGQNVGATTPMGRYPEGVTPTGLMDMAGNVWEWMENFYDKDEDSYALRGGSWSNLTDSLRCSARGGSGPRGAWNSYGFRVLRAQSCP
jgi:formylglycine-generating enzyme required for sulfatase activity